MLGSQAFDSFSLPDTRTSEQQPKERGGRPLLRWGGGRKNTFPGITPPTSSPKEPGTVPLQPALTEDRAWVRDERGPSRGATALEKGRPRAFAFLAHRTASSGT